MADVYGIWGERTDTVQLPYYDNFGEAVEAAWSGPIGVGDAREVVKACPGGDLLGEDGTRFTRIRKGAR
jgi:hypothetical protein